MSIKLTDAQLAMLTAASLRDDRCLAMPKNLRGSAAQKVFAKLSAEGLAKETIAKAGMPVWRRDEEAGRSYSLKLTAAGFKAAAAKSSNPLAVAKADETPTASKVAADPVIAAAKTPAATTPAVTTPATITATGANQPREGTKIADVLGLLRRSDGATLAEMIAATDWLPHTTRAALTGLRKRGYEVGIDRSDKERGSIYRVAGDAKLGETGADMAADAEIEVPDNVPSASPRRLKRAGAATSSQARKAA
jgi:cell wall-associated NlpC family hydrolase